MSVRIEPALQTTEKAVYADFLHMKERPDVFPGKLSILEEEPQEDEGNYIYTFMLDNLTECSRTEGCVTVSSVRLPISFITLESMR